MDVWSQHFGAYLLHPPPPWKTISTAFSHKLLTCLGSHLHICWATHGKKKKRIRIICSQKSPLIYMVPQKPHKCNSTLFLSWCKNDWAKRENTVVQVDRNCYYPSTSLDLITPVFKFTVQDKLRMASFLYNWFHKDFVSSVNQMDVFHIFKKFFSKSWKFLTFSFYPLTNTTW